MRKLWEDNKQHFETLKDALKTLGNDEGVGKMSRRCQAKLGKQRGMLVSIRKTLGSTKKIMGFIVEKCKFEPNVFW
jgi:hypothetical protein